MELISRVVGEDQCRKKKQDLRKGNRNMERKREMGLSDADGAKIPHRPSHLPLVEKWE